MKEAFQFILDHWQGATGIGALLWELIVRLNPSEKSLSVLTLVFRIVNAIIPDKNGSGGTHIVVLMFSMLSIGSFAQNNIQGKAMYVWDASPTADATVDTTGIKNTLTSYQNRYTDAGGFYYNKFSHKWRIWAHVCPDTSQHDGCWVDLPTSQGATITANDGLTKTGNNITFGGTILSTRSLLSGITHVQDWSPTGEPTIGFNAANTSGVKGTDWISIGNTSNNGIGAIGNYSVALGYNTKTRGLYDIALGVNAGSTTGSDNGSSISIGALSNGGNKNIGDHSIAIGYQSESQGTQSIAIGFSSGESTGTTGMASISMGTGSNSGSLNIGDNSIAIGNASFSPTQGSVSIGDNAASTSGLIGQDFVSIGSLSNQGTEPIGDYGVSIGYNSHVQGIYGLSLGVNAGSSSGTDGGRAISIGASANNIPATNIGLESTAIGYQVNSTATGSVTMGYGNTVPLVNTTGDSFGLGWDSATPDILFTKANGWNINGFYGHVGYNLESDSTLGAPRWRPKVAPASPDHGIQYDSSGLFAANNHLKWSNSSHSMTVTNTSGTETISIGGFPDVGITLDYPATTEQILMTGSSILTSNTTKEVSVTPFGISQVIALQDLQFSNTGGKTMTLTSDGRFYGNALHNNGGSLTGTSNQYIASGTYTPTLSNGINVSATTPQTCQFIRTGNVVAVTGNVTLTSAIGNASFNLTLPITSNFTTSYQAGGSGGGSFNGVVNVTSSSGGSTLQFFFASTSVSTYDLSFSVQYEIR